MTKWDPIWPQLYGKNSSKLVKIIKFILLFLTELYKILIFKQEN